MKRRWLLAYGCRAGNSFSGRFVPARGGATSELGQGGDAACHAEALTGGSVCKRASPGAVAMSRRRRVAAEGGGGNCERVGPRGPGATPQRVSSALRGEGKSEGEGGGWVHSALAAAAWVWGDWVGGLSL
ncbi:hypothetical protein ABZP36_006418 [Zizania latifolia]